MMRVWNRRGLYILAFLLFFALCGILVIFLTGKSAERQLRADHDKGVKLIREYWSREPARPVLRGEALPGNGGSKLAEMLDVMESEQPKPPWSLLLSSVRGKSNSDSRALRNQDSP